MERLTTFLAHSNVLSNQQFGFRPGKSTIDALTKATDEIYNNIENKKPTIGMFLDLTKAFDCVNINLLLRKLYNYGIRGKAGELLQSYLKNRQQYVELQDFDNTNTLRKYSSDTQPVSSGVPQGSVIGPLLYLLYVNSIIEEPTTVDKMLMFADDTSLLFTSPTLIETQNIANQRINQISNQFADHSLLVNSSKTNYIIFKTPQSNINTNLDILLNNIKLQQTEHTKFLGLVIDNNLNWRGHIQYLTKKISSALFLLRRMSQIGSQQISLTVYYTLIQSVITYGINLWGASNETNVQQIFRLQKKAVRYINNLGYRDSCQTTFRQLQILTVPSLFIYQTLLHNFDTLHTLPRLGDTHEHNTRHRTQLAYTKHTTHSYEKHSSYLTAKLFNKLPTEIKSTTAIKKNFKKSLRDYLLNKCLYSVNEF